MGSHAARYQSGSPAADQCGNVAEQLRNALRLYKHHGVGESGASSSLRHAVTRAVAGWYSLSRA